MKTIRFLRPNIESGYFDERNEMYRYLYVPDEIGRDTLENDIEAGAEQYSEIPELLKHEDIHYIVIEPENIEEGLAAVSYISAVLRQENKRPTLKSLFPDIDAPDEINTEETEETDAAEETKEEKEWNFSDFEAKLSAEFGFEFDEDDSKDEDEDDDEDKDAGDSEDEKKSPKNAVKNKIDTDDRIIPIIDEDDLGFGIGMQIPADGFFMQIGLAIPIKPRKNSPYWMNYKFGEICIIRTGGEFDYSILDRFDSNQRVYIINLSGTYTDFDSMEEDEDEAELTDQWVSDVLLNYTADHIFVGMSREKREIYEEKLLSQWLEIFDLQIDEEIERKYLIRKIKDISKGYPSATMEKVLKHFLHYNPKSKTIKKADLKKLGFRLANSDEMTLDDLTGMAKVKEEIEGIISMQKYLRLRSRFDDLSEVKYQNVFLFIGAPGTAKTTVAKILGQNMAKEGFLRGEKFLSITGAQLKGKYVGHTAPQVHEYFEKNDIIFIDEAYSIVSDKGEKDTFSEEALAQLAVELEDHGRDKLIIFAGYGGKEVTEKSNLMKTFLEANPGISSRINETIVFESYSVDEMYDIIKGMAKKLNLVISDNSEKTIKNYFKKRISKDDFGNGREARRFVENCMKTMAKRIAKMPDEEKTKDLLTMVTEEDVVKTLDNMTFTEDARLGIRKEGIGFAAKKEN